MVGKRAATEAEAKALANPLRLRILRLCLDESLTNKQIAGRLGRDPATTLHHVRTLVDTGFLAAEAVRHGERGALEKPYRATGKSWDVTVIDPDIEAVAQAAMVDAFREELVAEGPDRTLFLTRFANHLDAESYAELSRRIEELVHEFALRNDPEGVPMAFFLGAHVRGVGRPPWADRDDDDDDDAERTVLSEPGGPTAPDR